MNSEERAVYNGRIEALQEREYPMLKDDVYLDHAGTTLYAKSLMDRFATDMNSNLFGNPHSASGSSQLSTSRIDDIRLRVLQFLHADPSEFDLVFVANATAGVKLVLEAFRSAPEGFGYAYHQACHTSLVGVRQEARNSHCLDDEAMKDWLAGCSPFSEDETSDNPKLFAYPAQSNMDGRRYPLDWSSQLRARNTSSSGQFYTLLDAAAYVSTSPLDLGDSEAAPDFTVLSFYKIFGFPDLGALIVRRQAAPIFRHRKYFGGGTVELVVCSKEQWHAPKMQTLHDRLEDGSLPIHSIITLNSALDVHLKLFGSMENISLHTSFLARRLRDKLRTIRHPNGEQVCEIYSPESDARSACSLGCGPVIAFNIRNHYGAWISPAELEKLATLKRFHIRTGGLCNPGGIAKALGLHPWEVKSNFSAGFRCDNESDIMNGKPTGVVRISLGAMSTVSDVDRFVAFISEFYRTEDITSTEPGRDVSETISDLYVHDLVVYPIKSCGGFHIPRGIRWAVRPEGLAWDREWCLMHRGTGQALSQKRHPRMALLRPFLNFDSSMLEVSYCGDHAMNNLRTISVPLSANPEMFQPNTVVSPRSSRVCGDEVSTQTYTSNVINDFFSSVLGVSCVLARFPPGGQGKSMRHAKAHLQKHQQLGPILMPHMAGNPSGVETPPDSDSENERRRILLSNESPILAINACSLDALNSEIAQRGGKPVSTDVFRANVVIGSSTPQADTFAYSEDHWSRLRIGQQNFKMLGSCRRCHMVCINQETAVKSEEPFITLTKTRRFEGKVFFGVHMCHLPSSGKGTVDAQHPTVKVGDKVLIDAHK